MTRIDELFLFFYIGAREVWHDVAVKYLINM